MSWMQRLRKFFGLCPHDWPKWEVKYEADIQSQDKDRVVGHLEVQRRECKLCGESQLRSVRVVPVY